MAGAGAKLFSSGAVLTADQVNTYLMDQTIMKFASTTTRDAAFGGAGEPTLAEGMFAYTTDTNTLWFYTGSTWQNVLGSNIGEISTSNRNAVINGAMQIFQRGTSFSSIGFTAYTADRMFFFCGLNINRTVTRQNTSDTTNLPNLFFCTRVQRTAAATDLNVTNLSQSFESTNSVAFSGRSATFSFYARAGANFSAASSTLTATVRSGTGADENIANGYTGQVNVIASSATLTTTWQRFTFTGTVGATATELGWVIGYTPVGTAGAADYFEVTGIQLEVGSVATPFEFEDIGTTLAKCQRYYHKATAGYLGVGMAYSTTGSTIFVKFPTTMRIAPSAVETTGTAGNYLQVLSNTGTQACNAVPTFTRASTEMAEVSTTSASTGLVQGNATFVLSNTGSTYLAFSAEL